MRFVRPACWLALLFLLVPGHASASGGGSEIALVYQGNQRPELALKDLLDQFGSEVTGVVLRPEGGGYLVSVTRPADEATAQQLFDALGADQGVKYHESNVCYEYYPDDIEPNNERTMKAPPPPTPEQLLAGQDPGWTADTLQQSTTEGGGREFHSQTRDPLKTQTRKTVGWSMVRDPGIEIPPTSGPPITPDDYSLVCQMPTPLTNKTPDIKLALEHGAPGEFQYPRPIPLQVIARDYDELQYGCGGCGGDETNDRRYLEDTIGLYKWDFKSGKGSLNKPYKDVGKDIQKRIEELRKEIAAKSAELEKLKAEKDALDATRKDRKEALEEAIKNLEAQEKETQEKLDKLKAEEIDPKERELGEVTGKLEDAQKRIAELLGEIDKLNGEIEELEDRIDGEPSAATQQIAKRLEQKQKQIEAKEAEIAQLEAQNVAKEQALAQAYDQAIDNLVTARQNLADARARAVAKQNEILALENKLYSSPALLQAMRQQATLIRLGIDLQNRFLGGGLPPTRDLVQKAQQVFRAPNPGQKQSALSAFQAEQTTLLSRLTQQCASSSSPGECNNLLSELRTEAESLNQTLTDAVNNPASGGDPKDWEKLDQLRDEQAQLEDEIRAAEQQVTAAEQGVSQAEQTYLNGLQQLQDDVSRKQKELTDLQTEAETVKTELAEARAKDEEERLQKTPEWLDQIAAKRSAIEELERELAAKRLEAEIAQGEKDRLEEELTELKAERADLERRLAFLRAQLAAKRAELAAIDTETKELEDKIKELEDAIADLEEELKKLLEGVDALAAGQRSAEGQQVFFIPPPLEHTDGFDTPGFEEKKKALAEAEAAYQKARAAKARLQDDAYKILKGFTEQLWNLKTANETLEGIDDEIAELNKKKSEQQLAAADEASADVAKEEQRRDQLNTEKDANKTAVDEAKAQEDQTKDHVKREEDLLKEKTQARSEIEQVVEAKQSALDAKDAERRRVHAQQSTKFEEFRRTVASQQEAEAKLGRAQSKAARAAAAEDDSALNAAQSEIDALKREIQQLETQIDSQRGPLLQLDRQYARLVQEQEQAQKELDDAQKEARKRKKDFWDQVKLVKLAQDDLREDVEKRLAAERKLRQTEDDLKRQEERIKQSREDLDKAVDDAVADVQKDIDDKTKEKTDAEGSKNKATNKLNEWKRKKTEWDGRRTAAETELVKARDALKAARDGLKKFLTDQFNGVKHRVTLELIVDDSPLGDGFREDDEPRKVPITIEYKAAGGSASTTRERGAPDGGRTPDIKGPDEDLDPPSGVGPADAICKLTVGWVQEPAPTMAITEDPALDEEVGEEGLEPKTIALYFDQGAPLYDFWPPVPGGSSGAGGGGSGGAGGAGGDPVDAAEAAANAAVAAAEAAAAAAVAAAEEAAADAAEGEGGESEEEVKELLVNASTPYKTMAVDTDEIRATCEPGGDAILIPGGDAGSESSSASGPICTGGGSTGGAPGDPPHPDWNTDTYTSRTEVRTMIRVPKVKDDECKGEPEFEVKYYDSKLQFPDEKTKKHKYENVAGKQGDAPTEYSDFGKENKIELRFQIYEGGHKGKSDQTVKWKVTSIQPALDEDKYGLGSAKAKELEEKTDGSGYSKVDFFLDERYGLATVTAEWKRGDNVCASAEMKIIRPLQLRLIKVGFAPKNGWKQGKEAFNGSDKWDDLAKALEGDGAQTSSSIAVGLLDDWMDPVDEKKILFSVLEPNEASIDPEEMATEVYGLAWSFAKDVPEEAQVKMKAEVEAELVPVTEPSEVEGSQSTETQNRFKIGPEGGQLTIETDEPFVPGEEFSSSCKLVIEGPAGPIPIKFKQLQLSCDNVIVDENGVATDGSVNWKPSGAAAEEFSVLGYEHFKFKLASLGLTAGNDGKIAGEIQVPKREDWIQFEAILGPKGFIGTVRNFPEVEVAGFKLEKGAAFVLDMHEVEEPGGGTVNLGTGWTGKGFIVLKASVLLPESMKGDNPTPPKISLENVYYSATGLNGKINVAYTVSAKLGKVEFSIEHVEVEFQAGELHAGTFKGKITLAEPFHGNIGVTVSLDRDGKYSGEMTTDRPIVAPSLGLTLKLDKLAISYDQGEKLFTFELAGRMKSKTFSELVVNEFKVTSKGDLDFDLDINKDMKFGKGFEARVGGFSLKIEETVFKKMQLRDVGLNFFDTLEGTIEELTIVEGPKIESFDVTIKADKDPVSFEAKIKYDADVFEGTVKLDAKIVEIDGTFILGTQKKEDDSEFTYWYVELSAAPAKPIPLGQTGIGLVRVGGGVGYNYDPPIGDAPGAVRNTDAFSFKLAVTVGDAVTGGKAMAGRLTLVLVSGRFSVNGKVWVLDKESSLFGEGQLNLYWDPSYKLDGFVRMLIALPGTDGGLLRLNGQVDFRFEGTDNWEIKSRTLEGALLEKLIAEGTIEISPGSALLDGQIRMDIDKQIPLAVVTLQLGVHLRANGKLDFKVESGNVTLKANADANGDIAVTVLTKVKNFDLARLTVSTKLEFTAENTTITVYGEAKIEWDTWVHSGSIQADVGYTNAS